MVRVPAELGNKHERVSESVTVEWEGVSGLIGRVFAWVSLACRVLACVPSCRSSRTTDIYQQCVAVAAVLTAWYYMGPFFMCVALMCRSLGH
jgi:hypothetical protein